MLTDYSQQWNDNLHVSPIQAPVFIAVLSGKGGIGKSIIAHNLAVAIGRSGARVALVDMDWRLGSLHLLANAAVNNSVATLVNGEATVADTAIAIAPNVDFFASACVTHATPWPSVTATAHMMTSLRNSLAPYSYVVFDTPSGLVEQVSVIAHGADRPFLITAPEMTAIADCYGMYKFFLSHGKDFSGELLVNRVSDDVEADDIAQRLNVMTTEFLGATIRFMGCLPEERAVAEAVSRQQAVVTYAPSGRFTSAVSMLAGRVIGRALKNRTNSKEVTNTRSSLNKAIHVTDYGE